MKGYVDEETCIGCGICEAVCSNVFKMNDEGKAVAINSEIEESDLDDALSAKEQCPVDAIKVE